MKQKNRRMKRIIWLFCLSPLLLSAQKVELFKGILKESLRPEFSVNLSLDFSDSMPLKKPKKWDITKDYIPSLGFNYKQNYLYLLYKEDFTYPKPLTVSPHLTAPYSNEEKYDPNSTETTGDVIANVILYPIGSVVTLNPIALFDYMMRIGILPDDPFVPKKSRKARMLKTITQDVYHIDDDY